MKKEEKMRMKVILQAKDHQLLPHRIRLLLHSVIRWFTLTRPSPLVLSVLGHRATNSIQISMSAL